MKATIRRGDVFSVLLPTFKGPTRREVLVLQNDIGNRVCPTIIVADLTRNPSARRLAFAVRIPRDKMLGLSEDRFVICSQIYTLDRRLMESDGRLGSISPTAMERVEEGLKLSLGMSTLQRLQAKSAR